MIESLTNALDRLWLAQFALAPLVLAGWLALRLLPLRPATRALGALVLLATLVAPALMPTLAEPGATLAKVRSQFARTDLATPAGTTAHGLWPWSAFETIWIAGSLIMLFRCVLRVLGAHRHLQALPEAPADIRGTVHRIAAEAGVRPPDVRATGRPSSPALFCITRPVLVIPLDVWRRLPDSAVAPVVRHELAHLRRGDPGRFAVAALVGCALWWNPLVWWLRARMRRYGEMAADAWALRHGDEQPEEMAQGLLVTQECIEPVRGRRHAASSIAAVSSRAGRQMARRIRQLFRGPVLGGAAIGAVLCLAVAWFGAQVGWIAAQTPGHHDPNAAPLTVRGFLVRALITLEGDSRPERLPFYVEQLQSAASAELRRRAADDLGNLFEEGMPALPVLMQALERDPSESVRYEAIDALARMGAHDSPGMNAYLARRLEREPASRVRRKLAEVIAR